MQIMNQQIVKIGGRHLFADERCSSTLRFQEHFDKNLLGLFVHGELDILDAANAHASEFHWRADLQTVHRAGEIDNKLIDFLKIAAAAEYEKSGDGQYNGAYDEKADDGGIGSGAHWSVLPLSGNGITLGMSPREKLPHLGIL